MYLKKSTLKVSFFLLTFIYCIVYVHVCEHAITCACVCVTPTHVPVFHDVHMKVR